MDLPPLARGARGLLPLFLLSSSLCARAAEIAADPGDYKPLPPGATLGILYLQHAERDAYYTAGARLPGRFRLQTDIGLARIVHYTKVGSYVFNPQAILPFGRVALKTPFGPLGPVSASGTGDPIVGGTLWVLNEEARSLGLSAFVSIPLGRYDGTRGPVNVGENRWKGIFQAGYVVGMGKNWTLDLVGETALYGDNDDFLGLRRKQDASYGLQAHLRYGLSQTSSVSLSYLQDFGGETRLAGMRQDDRMNNRRWEVGYATFLMPTLQLMVEAGKGGKTVNGARESSRFNLRLVQVF